MGNGLNKSCMSDILANRPRKQQNLQSRENSLREQCTTRKVGTGGGGGGWGGTTYNGLYGEAPPERGTFFRLEVYKRVRISRVEVWKRAGKADI